MDHDHGHWFIIGVLLSGVLIGGGYALRALIQGADFGVSPEAFLAAMIGIGALCVVWWRLENRA